MRFDKDDMDQEITMAILGGKKINHNCDQVVHTVQHQLQDSDYSGDPNPSPTIIGKNPLEEFAVKQGDNYMPPTAGTEESRRLNVYEPFTHKSNKPEAASFI